MSESVCALFKDGKTIVDPMAISFDRFYEALVHNNDFETGKLIGDVLIEKFQKSFLPLTQELLPTGIDMNWSLDQAKKDAKRVFAQHEQNREIYRKRQEAGSALLKGVYAYHHSLLLSGDQVKKQESLKKIKEALQPLFTEHLKQEEAVPPKPLWKRLFDL